MLFDQKDRILFTGDSVTDARRTRPVGEGLGDGVGHGYVRYIDMLLSAFRPAEIYRLTNMAIGGQTSRDLVAQWDECMALSPDWVCIEIGVNDVWRQFDCFMMPDSYVLPDEYERNLRTILETTLPKVKGVILMTPYYMEINKKDAMRSRLDEYGAIVKRLASEYGTLLVDLQAVFDDFLQYRYPASMSWDRVHPDEVACTLIARAFLDVIGLKLSLEQK